MWGDRTRFFQPLALDEMAVLQVDARGGAHLCEEDRATMARIEAQNKAIVAMLLDVGGFLSGGGTASEPKNILADNLARRYEALVKCGAAL